MDDLLKLKHQVRSWIQPETRAIHEFGLIYYLGMVLVLVPTKDGDKRYSKKKGCGVKEKKSFHASSRVSVQTMEGSHQGKYRWPGCTVVAFRFLVKHISQATILAEREKWKKRENVSKRNFSGMKVETVFFWGCLKFSEGLLFSCSVGVVPAGEAVKRGG